jgi:malate dehydrogenase (oxaloacetate-decarboxylating)
MPWSSPDSASVSRWSGPRRITDEMIAAAADAVAALADPSGSGRALLPPVTDLRRVSAAIAIGIAVAQAAEEQGLAEQPLTDPVK